MQLPPELRFGSPAQDRLVQPCVQPLPEDREALVVMAQQVMRSDKRLPYTSCQARCRHSVLDGQNASLIKLAHLWVTDFGCRCRRRTRHFGKRQIWIAGRIRFQHRRIATESGRYAEFLVAPIDISKPISF